MSNQQFQVRHYSDEFICEWAVVDTNNPDAIEFFDIESEAVEYAKSGNEAAS